MKETSPMGEILPRSTNKSIFDRDRFQTEIELLGALLGKADPVLYRAAAAIVGPQHFGDNFNARLYSHVGKGFDEGLHGFRLTAWVIAQLRGDETLVELGQSGSEIVARYMSEQCPPIGVEAHARQVRHDALSIELKHAVEDGNTAVAEAVAAEMERLSKAHLVKDAGLQHISDAAEAVVARLDAAFRAGELRNDAAWPGSFQLQNVMGGWRPGRMYVIGGRPGAGKTTAGLSFAVSTAKRGHGVLFVELEMGREELTEMALCDLAWTRRQPIEYRDLQLNTSVKPEFQGKLEALIEARERLKGLPLLISDRPGLSLAEIRSQAIQFQQRLAVDGKKLELVVVDHLSLIKAGASYAGNKVAETEEVSNGLKAMAKELQCAVLVLAQLNRGVEGRDDKRPSLADLRWSGAVEQDADMVMFVYREAYYLSKPMDDPIADTERKAKLELVRNRLELIIAKHRGGPTPTLNFFCDMGCGVVRDMEDGRG
jgi:replicative DNA helicase